ncbi:hypothetical protein GCM10027580_25660 [Corynebacterium faecale]
MPVVRIAPSKITTEGAEGPNKMFGDLHGWRDRSEQSHAAIIAPNHDRARVKYHPETGEDARGILIRMRGRRRLLRIYPDVIWRRMSGESRCSSDTSKIWFRYST